MTGRRRYTTRRNVYRAAHWYYLTRAILRGPVYLLGYLIRRAARRAAWKATRGMR